MPSGWPGSTWANRTGTERIDTGLDWGDWRGEPRGVWLLCAGEGKGFRNVCRKPASLVLKANCSQNSRSW